MTRRAIFSDDMIEEQVRRMIESDEPVNVSRVRAKLGGGSHKRIAVVINNVCGDTKNHQPDEPNQSPDDGGSTPENHVAEIAISTFRQAIAQEIVRAKKEFGEQFPDLLKAALATDHAGLAGSTVSNERVRTSELYQGERRRREASEAVARELKSELEKRNKLIDAFRADISKLTNDLIKANADVTSLRLRLSNNADK